MTRNILVTLFVVVLVLGAFGSVSAEPLQWSGNGHFYEVSNVSLHWSDAKVFAENQTFNGMKGHLVTITSAEEDAFIMQLDLPDTYYHTGALQQQGTQDPLANWTWITGEPWVYENWVGSEPNDTFGEEDNMVVMKAAGGWGDMDGDDHSYSWTENRFIVEYEPVSESLTISPPSGDYVTTQVFDLTLIVEAPSLSVVGGTATLDDSDVTGALVACIIPGTLVSGGGQTFRCPGLTGSFLGTGTHTLNVTLDLSDSSTVSDTVNWEVKENTEP